MGNEQIKEIDKNRIKIIKNNCMDNRFLYLWNVSSTLINSTTFFQVFHS